MSSGPRDGSGAGPKHPDVLNRHKERFGSLWSHRRGVWASAMNSSSYAVNNRSPLWRHVSSLATSKVDVTSRKV